MRLPSLITLQRPLSRPLEPEDIFGSTLGSIFTDDLQNQHGDDPETTIVYRSAHHGDLEFQTADVNGEEQRTKFAHYLWNAGVLMAELVGGRGGKRDEIDEDGWKDAAWWVGKEEEELWSVREETVLELGAGVGLGGVASVLAEASQVVITDYPAPPILTAIEVNVEKNVPKALASRVVVEGHKWGSVSSPFESEHAHRYTRVLAADCLWMPHEHENLAKSMLHFLADSPSARIFCIAGFHTGRAKVAPFFDEVVPRHGLMCEEIYEMDADGARRPWAVERDGGREHIGERKKWLIVARIQRIQ